MVNKKLIIFTSGDKWLVPLIVKKLILKGFEIKTVRINSNKNNFSKNLRIIFLFNIKDMLNLLIRLFQNHWFKYYDELNEDQILEFLNNNPNDNILLINLSTMFPLIKNRKILNFHPSLLPSYRGLMSIPRIKYHKMLGYESFFGSTIHEIDSKLDKGNILWQKILYDQKLNQNLFSLYESCYQDCADGISEIFTKKLGNNSQKFKSSYSKTFSYIEILHYKFLKLVYLFKYV